MIAAGMPHIDNERKERLEKFSRYAAILPWFNIDVLHKLYINIFEKQIALKKNSTGYRYRAITCADLIHSPQIDRIGYNTFIMHAPTQDTLRNELISFDVDNAILTEIGNFMLSYTWECREHFPSPKHLESFRIEGNIIIDPTAEAERVTKNIVNRFNQQDDTTTKKKAVAYYLKVLDQNNLTQEQEKLVEFLNIYQKLDPDSEGISGADRKRLESFLPDKDRTEETITIKLPGAIKKKILDGIKDTSTNATTLYALIVGINDYPDYEDFRLQSAVNDANAIRDYLEEHIAEGRTIKTHLLLNEHANYRNIERYLETELLKEMKPGDAFVFYYAGQGGTFGDMDLIGKGLFSDVLKTAMARFSGDSASRDKKIKGLLLSDSTTLSILDLFNRIGSFPASCTYTLLLDTDFTRGLENMQTNVEEINSMASSIVDFDFPKWVMITAVSEDQSAYEDPEHGHFTRGLLQVLRNEENTVPITMLPEKINASLASFNTNQVVSLNTSDRALKQDDFLFGFLKNPYSESLKLIQGNKAWKEETLDLKNKGLTHIPEEIFDLEHLKVLDLSENKIDEIPDGLAKLINLEELNLSNNENLGHIDFDFGKLKKLRVLKFNKCSVQVFPKSILKVDQLEELELAGTDLRIIPNALGNLRHLQKLDLTDNEIVNFDIAHLEGNHVECLSTLPSIEDADDMARPMALLVGMDYYDKLKYMVDEIDEISDICERSGIEVVKVINPTGSALNKIMHRYQKRLSILHVVCLRMDLISIENDKVRELRPYGWVEFFRCITPERFDTPLLFLNCCYAEDIIKPLLDEGVFKLGIGIKDEIDDRLAYQFGVQFYTSLVSEGMTITEAVTYAERTLYNS